MVATQRTDKDVKEANGSFQQRDTSPLHLAMAARSARGDAPDTGPRAAVERPAFVCHTTPADDDARSHDVWGFADTQFVLEPDGTVQLTGGRYPLSGKRLPDLLPWVERTMGIEVPRLPALQPLSTPHVPEAKSHPAFAAAVRAALGDDALDTSDVARMRRGHGHTQEEMYAIKHGHLARVPDMVLYPASEEDVATVVALAQAHGICLIPFGGGTNVTWALRCPENEVRPIASVDTSRMDRILWLDPVNRMARVEAGAVGRHLAAALAERGWTMGHEPDSIELSTLGGWIATNASGMKKNKYGNIEDIVLDMNVVTAQGTMQRAHVAPRESVGMDARQVMFGSEGNLGIITSAVVKLFALPQQQVYGSVLFPSFEDGVHFLYALKQTGEEPASVRLMDNVQFQLGMTLKPASEGLRALKGQAEKFFVTKVKGFDESRMVACTLVFEGSAEQVKRQQEVVYRVAAQHRGLRGGAENGERGYQLTFGIAYIRDFVMKHLILADSFETSLPWTQVLEVCERVKKRVRQEHAALGLPGKPLVMSRVTQLYDTGVAVYFYIGICIAGVSDPTATYVALDRVAHEEILAAGGTLSHHHGVGKLRQNFLKDIASPGTLAMRRQLKRAIDPDNVFGARNAQSV